MSVEHILPSDMGYGLPETPVFYAHQCPETGRWFVCHSGLDNNVCECFDWNGRTAEDWAKIIADHLTESCL